jgi:hypothetical protein
MKAPMVHCILVFGIALLLGAAAVDASTISVNALNLKGKKRDNVAITVTAEGLDENDNVVALPSGANQVIRNGNYSFNFDANVKAVTLTFRGAGLETTTLQRVFNNADRTIDIGVPEGPSNDHCCDLYSPPRIRHFGLFRR